MFARPLFAGFLLAALTLTASTSAVADCPMQKVEINGRVLSKDQPVANALVLIRWDEQRTRNVSAEARTDAEGNFQLALSIDSFDGRTLLAKEKCGYSPEEMNIEVHHPDHRKFQRSYEMADLSAQLVIEVR